jgi:hypothetical protein
MGGANPQALLSGSLSDSARCFTLVRPDLQTRPRCPS